MVMVSSRVLGIKKQSESGLASLFNVRAPWSRILFGSPVRTALLRETLELELPF
jgi:hypothetical protein